MTVRFSKLKAKRNRDEEKLLTSRFAQLSAKLQTAYSEDDKAELERIKILNFLIFNLKRHAVLL